MVGGEPMKDTIKLREAPSIADVAIFRLLAAAQLLALPPIVCLLPKVQTINGTSP
jgi:hypothetical protein